MKVTGKIDHSNINITNQEKSIAFYEEALRVQKAIRKETAEGSFTWVYLTDGSSNFMIE